MGRQLVTNVIGPQGPQGPQGVKGDQGVQGVKGDRGPVGPAPTLTAGTGSTLAPGATTTIAVRSTGEGAYALDLGVAQGAKGEKGDPGNASAAITDGAPSSTTAFSSQKVTDLLEGKADSSHTHAAADTTSGVFAAARLPLASTSGAGAVRLATVVENAAGASSTLAATPAGLAAFEAAKRPVYPNAVILGSSNALASTGWPQQVCSYLGVTPRFFSVGGAAFHDSNDDFLEQANRAAADTTFTNASVGVVLLADCSNDVRARVSTMGTRAPMTLDYVKSTFPNARVIVVPVIWPSRPLDFTPDGIGGWQRDWTEWLQIDVAILRQETLDRQFEFVEDSWTWLTGHPEWMSAAKDVHPNTTGYTQVARWVIRYLKGGSTRPRTRWFPVPSKDGATYDTAPSGYRPLLVKREGWSVSLQGYVRNLKQTGTNWDWAMVPTEFAPNDATLIPCRTSTGTTGMAEVFPDGTLRVYMADQAANSVLAVNGQYEIG